MSGILLGALAIIAGLIFCFRGYLALRTVIAIWGAFVGFALGSGLASAATGDPPLTGVIGWSAAVVGAMLITWLSYTFYAVAVVMVMTSVGFGLGAAIASFFNAPAWVDVVVGLAGAVLLVVLALATNLPEILLVVVSASGGASAIVVGISVLMAGLTSSTALPEDLAPADQPWWLNVVFLVLFASGVVVQMRHRRPATLQEAYR